MATTKDIRVRQGKTFSMVVRWEVPPIVYKPITAVLQSAPVRITAANHDLPDGWRVAVTSIKGMIELNSDPARISTRDYHPATVLDTSTIELNDINAAGFKPYVSGGYVQYNTPVDLTGFTARMSVRAYKGGPVELLSLTTENGGIAIDPAAYSITLNISATDTETFAWKGEVYDLEVVQGAVVTALLAGKVTVSKEVTT